MMRSKVIITAIIATVMFAGLAAIKHIDQLNDGIQFKQIEIQDNSAKLKQLNTKYDELHKDSTLTEKEYEKQLKQLQEQRDALKADLEARRQVKEQTLAATTFGVVNDASASSMDAKSFIYMKESGNNPAAVNPIGCRGLGQACPGSKLPCSDSDYTCQDNWFTNYMLERYGSWEAARQFWLQNNWW